MAKQHRPRRAAKSNPNNGSFAMEQEPMQHPGTSLQLAKYALGEQMLPLPELIKGAHDDIKEVIYDRLVGQRPAIDAVIAALDRRYARTDEKPIAAMMFLGPTGVGKTEVAKAIVEAFTMRGQNANLVTVDCSTLSSHHDGPAYLLGSPAGYVGYNDPPAFDPEKFAGPLTNDVTILLLDEIEKAAPDTWKTIMPVLDEGRAKLRNGKETSFANTIIIATSNVGAAEMGALLRPTLGFSADTGFRTPSMAEISSAAGKGFKEHFKGMPEFAGRFGTPIVFGPHTEESLHAVFDVNLAKKNEKLRENFGVEVAVSDAVRTRLVAGTRDESHLGARPVVHALEDQVIAMAGRYMSSGHLSQGQRLRAYTSHELAARDGKVTDVDRIVFGVEYDDSLMIPATMTPVVEAAQAVEAEADLVRTESE